MIDQPRPHPARRRTVLVVAVLVLVAAVVTIIALVNGSGPTPSAAPTPTVGRTTPTSTSPATSTASTATTAPALPATPTSGAPTTQPSDKATTDPTSQPTKTAMISKPTSVPITTELKASVEKMEAVKGTADGPGEVGGPSVRFTIKITNTTGKTYSLSNTVVNAYYGSAQSPAIPLRSPGGTNFPTSVKDGGSAAGVYLFNIPKASRGNVRVTLDTDVQNPVIAFDGAAPRS